MKIVFTQRSKTWLVLLVGVPLSILICWTILSLFATPPQHMINFGKTSVDAALISLLVVKMLWFVSYVWFVIVGFKIKFVWGILNLLVPVTAMFFTFFYFSRAKKPAVVYLSGLALLVLTLIWTEIR